jgi:hypothetical protein
VATVKIQTESQELNTNRPKPNFAVLVVVAVLLIVGAVTTLVLRLGEAALAKETENSV